MTTTEPGERKRFKHLISTAATEKACRCGFRVLAAYAEGMAVKADPAPIPPEAEYNVLVQGHRTYTRQPWSGLHYRTPEEITAGLRPGETIHVEHRCKGALW